YFFVSLLGERVVADIRARLYEHLLTLDLGFFESTRTGELQSRLSTDNELVQTVVGSSASIAVRSTVTLIGATALLVITSPRHPPPRPPPRRPGRTGDPAGGRADARVRPQRAQALAREPGPHRGRRRPVRRDAQRHPHRAGVRARGLRGAPVHGRRHARARDR